MPQDPATTRFATNVDIDDSKKYILKLCGLLEEPSLYREKDPNAMRMTWKWNVYEQDSGEAVIDGYSGEVWELWSFTDDTTFPLNPKTGKIGEAREVADALLGHKTTDDEIRQLNQEGWEESLMGMAALADLEWYTTKKGDQRVRVLRLRPYVKPDARRPRVGGERAVLER